MSTETERASQSRIAIIPSSVAYTERMEDLVHFSYGTSREIPDQVFTAPLFREHLNVFPEGQFIAIDTVTDAVVGMTVSMRTNFNLNERFTQSWWASTGFGWLTTHVPDGDWMYGVESLVHPAYRGHGVGSKLMDARFNVLRGQNLCGMVACSAIIDYYQYADHLTVEEYVAAVAAGRIFDTNLSKQLHKGFKAYYPIPDYVDQMESCGYGVLMIWDNPDYCPERTVRSAVAVPA